MKYLFTFLFCALWATTVTAAVRQVKIHGTIKGLGNNEVVLLDTDYSEIARVRGANDCFEIIAEVEADDARYYHLYVPAIGPLGPSMSVPEFFFFIDSPDIRVKAVIEEEESEGEKYKRISAEKITGSAGMKEHRAIFRQLPVRKDLEKATKLYNEAFNAYNFVSQTEDNHQLLKNSSHLLDSLQQLQAQQMLDLIPAHKTSKILATVIYSYFNYKPVEELEEIYGQFDPTIRDCYGLKMMQEKINTLRSCEVGQLAPDFELKDLNGQSVKLSSLRGKYTLIDFWASWCGPCRQEIPNLKKVYADYKDRGLQLIGVSLDNSDKNWRKAVEEEQLDYLQLNDPGNMTGKLYNFDGIPFIILISPEGIILEKGLRGEEVREKVARYLPAAHAEMEAKVGTDIYRLQQKNGTYYLLPERPESSPNPYVAFQKQMDSLNDAYNRLCRGYDKITDIHRKAEHSELLKVKFEEINRFYLEGIREFRGTVIAEYLIYKMLYSYENDYRRFTAALQAAGDALPQNELKQLITERYEQLKARQLRGQAPDFTLPDINGKTVSLKDLRGKPVLVDFWASWCAPCRNKNKELNKHYPGLHAKGLQVVSISLDENKQHWIKAVKEDQVSWLQLNDPDGFKDSKVREAYKVEQVPTVYLIDAEGRVVQTNPTLEEITKIVDK